MIPGPRHSKKKKRRFMETPRKRKGEKGGARQLYAIEQDSRGEKNRQTGSGRASDEKVGWRRSSDLKKRRPQRCGLREGRKERR